MAEVTSSSMRDARDAEDSRLLAEGEIDLLLGHYVDIVRARCIARMRDGLVGEDVAQAVFLRLWRELKLGRHRDGKVPFRVVVHQVIRFTCDGWYAETWGSAEIADGDHAVDDGLDVIDELLDLEAFVARLPPGDGDVAQFVWLQGYTPAEAARALGKAPNAVHQACSRNRIKLRGWLEEAA